MPAFTAAAADFQVTPVPSFDCDVRPLESPESIHLGMAELVRYGATAEFDRGNAPANEKAARRESLGRDVPSLAKFANQRSSDWQVCGFTIGMQKERATRETRDADWERLSKLLQEAGTSDTERTAWVRRFTEAYLRYLGLREVDLEEMLKLMPSGPFKDDLEKRRRDSEALRRGDLDALLRERLAKEPVDLAEFEVGFAAVGRDKAATVTSKKTGRRLFVSPHSYSDITSEPHSYLMDAIADDIAAFLKRQRAKP